MWVVEDENENLEIKKNQLPIFFNGQHSFSLQITGQSELGEIERLSIQDFIETALARRMSRADLEDTLETLLKKNNIPYPFQIWDMQWIHFPVELSWKEKYKISALIHEALGTWGFIEYSKQMDLLSGGHITIWLPEVSEMPAADRSKLLRQRLTLKPEDKDQAFLISWGAFDNIKG